MRVGLLVRSAALVATLLGSTAAFAAGPTPESPWERLRTSDAEVIDALTTCYRHSPLCRRLIDQIEASSTVVYLRRGQCLIGVPSSCLRFLAVAGDMRYLQLVLDQALMGTGLVSTAAHELQHVVEVVGAPEVVDVKSYRKLYARIGIFLYASGSREDWETREAQRVASAVAHDVQQSQRLALRRAPSGSPAGPVAVPVETEASRALRPQLPSIKR